MGTLTIKQTKAVIEHVLQRAPPPSFGAQGNKLENTADISSALCTDEKTETQGECVTGKGLIRPRKPALWSSCPPPPTPPTLPSVSSALLPRKILGFLGTSFRIHFHSANTFQHLSHVPGTLLGAGDMSVNSAGHTSLWR